MSKMISSFHNEKGSVILVALIILALLTILGISSTNTSNIEVRIATNSQDNQLDFYVADSGWKDAAMFLESQAGVPAWKNTAGSVVKNFSWNAGINDIAYGGAPPDPDFNALNPDSTLPPDGIDNDNDGTIDEAGETAFNSIYDIQYFYEIAHLPNETAPVPGSGAKYQRHYFDVTSNAKRAHLNNSTAEIQVNLSKIYATGYN